MDAAISVLIAAEPTTRYHPAKLSRGSKGDEMPLPWDDWIPGALNKPQMEQLLKEGFVTSEGSKPKVDHSSIDLSLSDDAYEMIEGSVKPADPPYNRFIKNAKLAKKLVVLSWLSVKWRSGVLR